MTAFDVAATWLWRAWSAAFLLIIAWFAVAGIADWIGKRRNARRDVRFARQTVAEWLAEVDATSLEPADPIALADMRLWELEAGWAAGAEQ